MSGTRQEFSRSLDVIGAKVSELFTMVAEDLPRAAGSLASGQGEAAGALAGREQVVDALYLEVEQLAGRELLLQAPVASDLRFLLSVLRITPELERSHDLVMEVASRAGTAAGPDLTPRGRALASQMGDLACQAWRVAAAAWRERDPDTVTALAGHDQEMDGLHAALTAELASGRVPASAAMEMALVARCYERLGAHAVNVARRMAYAAGPAAR